MARFENKGTNARWTPHQWSEIIVGDEESAQRRPCIDLFPFGHDDGTRQRIWLPRTVNDSRPNTRAGDVPWTIVPEKLAFRDGNIGMDVFEHPTRRDERGTIEVEFWLGEKPVSGFFEVPFETTGLTAHHQPALTAEEIERGAIRPDDIVNSYAFYHNTKGGMIRTADGERYKAGKAFHKLRSWAEDATGNRTWVIQELRGNLFRYTFPTAWLASATLPIRLGPTLGITTTGASSDNQDANYLAAAGPYTATENGTAVSVAMYFDNAVSATVTLGLYADSSNPTTLLADTAGGNTSDNSWLTLDLDTSQSLTTSSVYWAGFHNGVLITMKYDTDAAYRRPYKSDAYSAGTLDNPFGTPSGTVSNQKISAYINYNAAATGQGRLLSHERNQMVQV